MCTEFTDDVAFDIEFGQPVDQAQEAAFGPARRMDARIYERHLQGVTPVVACAR